MAIFNQRVNPNTPVSKAIGFNPLGVLVDNVTPYWLYFPQADLYCPPFTGGWSAPFTLNLSGYAYMEIKTPFGQTNQTDITGGVAQFVNLTWTDDPVAYVMGSTIDPGGEVGSTSVSTIHVAVVVGFVGASSNGTGFFVNANIANDSTVINYNGLTAALGIPFIINTDPARKRIRILTLAVSANLRRNDLAPAQESDSGFDFYLLSSDITRFQYATVVVTPWSLPTVSLVYPIGLDFTVGSDVNWMVFPHWADIFFNASATYQML